MNHFQSRSGQRDLFFPICLTALFSLIFGLGLPLLLEAKAPAPFITEDKEPTFKTPEALQKFKDACVIFSEKNWKEATKAFQEIVKDTADKASLKLVDDYVDAPKG